MEHVEMQKLIENAIRTVFGENVDSGRFIDATKIPFICKDIEDLRKGVQDINTKLDDKYVTRERFWPVQLLVFGCAGLLLTAVLLQLINAVHLSVSL